MPLRSRFRGLTERSGVLIEGRGGWGEFSPFSDYSPERAGRWLAAAIESAAGKWPEPRRTSVPVNATIPALPPEEAARLAMTSACSTVKVKVGDSQDVDRVAAVRAALGPAARIRIDVNAAWDLQTARERLAALVRYDLEYAEQPVATVDDMRRLRKVVDVPLAADESLRLAPDPLRIDLSDAADLLVLKVHPLGGVRRALQVAEAHGLPVVVSSALETSVGLAAGAALAACLDDLPYACGLGTALLLEGDVVTDPLVPVKGAVAVRRPAVEVTRLNGFEVLLHDALAPRHGAVLRDAVTAPRFP